MQTEDLRQLKLDLGKTNPTNGKEVDNLLRRSFYLLGLSLNDIAKAVGTTATSVENWIDGYTNSPNVLRLQIFKWISKQINMHTELVSYHATDTYGYKYVFDDANEIKLSHLTYQLSKCSKLLERMQLIYSPPQIRLSFFVNDTTQESVDVIEELHYLIAGLGGYAEVHIDGGDNAIVLPFAEKEKENKPQLSMSLRHCYEVKDGCCVLLEGTNRCWCSCCLYEKQEPKPKLETA